MTTSANAVPRYVLITGRNAVSLSERVCQALSMGYELYGSPISAISGNVTIIAQAVFWKSVGMPSGSIIERMNAIQNTGGLT